MSGRRMHPLLMAVDNARKIAKQYVELTGNESAQRKRFLRAVAEESETKVKAESSPERQKPRHLQVVVSP